MRYLQAQLILDYGINLLRKGRDTVNIIFKRKSVRSYLDIDVDDSTVEEIIRAGMAAPSAKNQRPWEFYVVRNKETLAKLATCTPYARPVAKAPVAIVACYRTKDVYEPMMTLLDMSCCCENMLIQAAAMEMGSVWLSFAPHPERQEPAKRALNLPEDLEVFAVLPVGYPAAQGKPIDRFEPARIHWEE